MEGTDTFNPQSVTSNQGMEGTETFNPQSIARNNGKLDSNCNQEMETGFLGERKKGQNDISLSFGERWRDPVFKEKYVYSIYMTVAFIALGMSIGQHGPVFLDIQMITNTDLETASAYFTGGNAGYLAGSIVTGLVYNKVNTPLLMFVSTLCTGLTNILIPYCKQFEIMVFVRFASAAFGGGLDTALNSEHMKLWGSEASGLLQLLHFSFSFGGVISPLFAEPFLAEKNSLDKNTTTTGNYTDVFNNTTLTTAIVNEESRVQYVFLITGIFTLITSLPFLVVFVKRRGDKKKQNVAKRKFSQRNVPFPMLILMLLCMCLFYFTYNSVEDTFLSFLMTFLVEEYDSVSKSKGAFVTAVAWASFAVGRFLMIFMTKFFTPVQILLMTTTAMVVSFSSFTILAYFGIVDALITLSAISALSFSGVFASGLSWVEKEMFQITGIISSCVFVSSSLGSMTNPLILGNLMEEYTNMWFCYLLALETFLMYAIFVGLLVFCRCYVDKKYGSLASHLTQTKDITVTRQDECDRLGDDDDGCKTNVL